MRSASKSAGFTLLETVIASAIFALLIALVMGMLGRAIGSAEMDLEQSFIEDQVQNAVDDIIQDLKETDPSMVNFYQFDEDGRTQTAITFPSARDTNGTFIFKVGGEVQNEPVWQSIRVYCYVQVAGQDGGWIYRYEDFSARGYTNPITVTNVTATTITVSDGTTFNRRGPLGANQSLLRLPGRFVQLVAEVPVDDGEVGWEEDPDLIEDVIVDKQVRPLRMTIRSEVAHKYPGLAGGSVITTLTNEVLSRNRN